MSAEPTIQAIVEEETALDFMMGSPSPWDRLTEELTRLGFDERSNEHKHYWIKSDSSGTWTIQLWRWVGGAVGHLACRRVFTAADKAKKQEVHGATYEQDYSQLTKLVGPVTQAMVNSDGLSTRELVRALNAAGLGASINDL